VPTHLLLDLDGTLTDSRDGIVRCISHALAKLGRPAPAASDLERYIGPPLARTFRTLLDSPDERRIELAVDAYRGLAPHFARIYGPDLGDLSGTKSSLIRRALATECLVPADVVMIGDRRDDVEAAKENGVRSIGVTWGYGSRTELELAGAEYIVDSVAELLTHLGAR
jgi:phosphoglycolate phosphatase